MEDSAHTGDDTRELGPAHDICQHCGNCRCDDCRDCFCDDPEPHSAWESCDDDEDRGR